MAKQSESPINLTPLDACPKPVCSDTLVSRFWESIFDEEKYSFSMDKQLKKSHFYKFSLVCVCVFFCAYVIFSICAKKRGFFALATEKKDWVL